MVNINNHVRVFSICFPFHMRLVKEAYHILTPSGLGVFNCNKEHRYSLGQTWAKFDFCITIQIKKCSFTQPYK